MLVDGKTLLILPEQGFGDMILLLRFIPTIQALGAKKLGLSPRNCSCAFWKVLMGSNGSELAQHVRIRSTFGSV